MSMNKKTLSIVVPVFDEAQNVPLVYEALRMVLQGMPKYHYELIFVNDGSADGSAKAIESLAKRDTQVKYIEFSRNFGKEMATTAGLEAARGDAVIVVDADLQHPPSRIPELVSRWEKGAEVVVGVRTKNHKEGLAKRAGSWLFYSLMRFISETTMEKGETDFRLIDHAVVDAFKQLPERQRMMRSLINWLGFKKELVYFEAPARVNGEAKYSTGKLFRLALHSFVSNSLVPLRLAGHLGLAITTFSGALGVIVFIERYVLNDAWSWNVSGTAQLAIINVFLVGIVLMALGIIALYIANIHAEVGGRPLYVVRKRKNFEEKIQEER